MSQTIQVRLVIDEESHVGRAVELSWAQGRRGGHFTRAAPGRATVSVDSSDGWLGPDNPAGAMVGKRASIGLRVAGDADWVTVFEGYVDRVDTASNAYRGRARIFMVDETHILAQRQITLAAGTPAEASGLRIKRVLTASGITDHSRIDDGNVTCLAIDEDTTKTALEWCHLAAITEGGLFWPRQGHVSFTERGTEREPAVTAGSLPGHAVFNWKDSSAADRQVMVSQVQWRAGDGTSGIEGTPGIGRLVNITTLSSEVDTEGLAAFLLSAFGRPADVPSQLVFDVASQTDSDVARQLMELQPGDIIEANYRPIGWPSNQVQNLMVGQISGRVSVVGTMVSVVLAIRFRPQINIEQWVIGQSALGTETALVASAFQPANHPLGREPAGVVEWASDQKVGAAAFAGGITSQVVPRYTSEVQRDSSEGDCCPGQVVFVDDGSNSLFMAILEDATDGWQLL